MSFWLLWTTNIFTWHHRCFWNGLLPDSFFISQCPECDYEASEMSNVYTHCQRHHGYRATSENVRVHSGRLQAIRETLQYDYFGKTTEKVGRKSQTGIPKVSSWFFKPKSDICSFLFLFYTNTDYSILKGHRFYSFFFHKGKPFYMRHDENLHGYFFSLFRRFLLMVLLPKADTSGNCFELEPKNFSEFLIRVGEYHKVIDGAQVDDCCLARFYGFHPDWS